MNRKEYNETVTLWSDALYRFVLKSSKDESMSDDVVQESFIALWDNHSDIGVTKAKSFLFTTAYRRMIDYIRQAKRSTTLDGTDNSETTSVDESYFDLCEALEKALARLPDIQRAVILLRDYEGYSYQEISTITDLSESQVKVYIFRARCAMKNYIGKKELLI
ncbi:MAG: RNA polymerase sigma factor [Marinifilaceae bacterium]